MKYTFLIAIALTGLIMSCSKEADYLVNGSDGPALDDIISFSMAEQPVMAADNASYYELSVQLHKYTDTLLGAVTFTVKGGTFANNDTIQVVNANSNGMAGVRVKSDTAGSAVVHAVVQKFYSIDTSLAFSRAYPQDMLASADKYVGDSIADFTFTVHLFRDPGKGWVSDPAKVYFTIHSLDTTLNLVIPDFAYSENQQATATATNPYHIKGHFELLVKTLLSDADTLTRSVKFQVE